MHQRHTQLGTLSGAAPFQKQYSLCQDSYAPTSFQTQACESFLDLQLFGAPVESTGPLPLAAAACVVETNKAKNKAV
jgi:hypothetical protein